MVDELGDFGAIDGGKPSIARASDRTYRRGLCAALFVIDVLAGSYLLVLTIVINFPLFGSAPTSVPREHLAYWLTVAILALLSLGIVMNVRAEARAGRAFPTGVVLAVLSLLPLVLGIAMLVILQPHHR